MVIALWFWLALSAGQSTWIVVAGGLLLGGSLYVISILLLGVEEARSLARTAARRMRRST
jgi:hypothetical protein